MNLGFFSEDAFLYKDLTQWMRRRTFVPTFIGLLALAEILSLTIMASTRDMEGAAGPAINIALTTILSVFMLIIAFSNYAHTNREFRDDTFDLYAVAGMSPERMVLGKLWTQMAQFLFGFFCIVPFIFFAFLLGGVDFSNIIYSIMSIVLTSIPIFILSILFAYSNRSKRGAVIFRVVAFLLGILFFFNLVAPIFVFMFTGRMGMSSSIGSAGFRLSWDFFQDFLLFLVFYTQICLLFFYIACNIISPLADSRETPIKLLTFTLSISLLVVFGNIVFHSREVAMFHFASTLIFFLLCFVGMGTLFSHAYPPALALRRAERAGPGRRWIYIAFAPGAQGTIHMMILILITVIAAVAVAPTLLTSAVLRTGIEPIISPGALWKVFSLPLQAPFFIAFPGILLLGARRYQGRRAGHIRSTIFKLWVGLAILAILLGILIETSQAHTTARGLVSLGTVASPFTSAFASVLLSGGNLFDEKETIPFVHCLMGIIGIALMCAVVVTRKRHFRENSGGLPVLSADSPATPVDTPPEANEMA